MPTRAQQRITEQRCNPRILKLWQALQPLNSCVSFMNTGAHPDDETSAMLAALSLRDGIKISYACANRGEGGQNDIGTQTTYDLGVLRTAEMEQAAEALGLRLYWLSETPEDTIFDFGFSKSGDETLAKWGHERTLTRFVQILRLEKPDIICPTFLDIPGQHGHHRAMTQLAHEAITASADPSFHGVATPAWQVKKMYLPAWSGAGDAYDDDLPPPPVTLTVDARGEDPVSGWTFEQIGQQSRRFHLTQGMGRWVSPGQERDWPLHLAYSHSDQVETSLTTALPANIAELANFANTPSIASALDAAQVAIDDARASFPKLTDVRVAASRALGFIHEAQQLCPDFARAEVDHRLDDKVSQLARVIRIAAGSSAHVSFESYSFRAGESIPMQFESTQGDAEKIQLDMILPPGWTDQDDRLSISDTPHEPVNYPTQYLPDNPTEPALQITLTVDGQTTTTRQALDSRPLLMPPYSATLYPELAVLNSSTKTRKIKLQLQDQFPADAMATLQLPTGWHSTRTSSGFELQAPDDVTPGLYSAALLLDGEPATTTTVFDYPHIKQYMRTYPAQINIRVLDVVVPQAKVAYVGGGNDRVAHWLAATGFDVVQLSDAELTNDLPLQPFDTLIIGLFAIRTRPVLQRIMPAIHRWVEQGGNLVTLYHRPWDDWNEHTIPPKRLQIGKPSLRWRVTDENATVTTLLPEHPLLNTPNKIEVTDWQGWHKERGLYFAKEWDTAYQALLSMADPDEDPHHGALLSATIGQGRHTHTSLILHHQMEKLVPGAFRLMANLVASTE